MESGKPQDGSGNTSLVMMTDMRERRGKEGGRRERDKGGWGDDDIYTKKGMMGKVSEEGGMEGWN